MVTKKSSDQPAGLPGVPCKPQAPPEFVMADGRDIRYIFVKPPKWVVGTTVPDPVYFQLLDYEGGISKFYEDAVDGFDGDLESLLRAAAKFGEERRRSRRLSPVKWCSKSGQRSAAVPV